VESLKLAEQYGVSSIAFPAIGTGAYRFPVKKASDIAIRTISLFLNSSSRVKEVLLVCFESKMARHLNTALNKLRDER
jgi:O-acetyl-ADP-ribose deacetylase (regulator of RNase III)